jgi:Icc-related predicted phosphoesterase
MVKDNTEKNPNANKVTIAAIGDLHMHHAIIGTYRDLFSEISEKADVLAICGDLTDHGYAEEAEMLIKELQSCKKPIVGVLGNHDFANGQQNEIIKIMSDSIFVLDEEPHEINGVGFAGVKGFGGGFDNHMLGSFGEETIRKFVYEAVDESLKLETALNKLETEKKVVIIHYAPIKDTVVGEPIEIYPFMGSSRLEDPIEAFNVSAVFHGHAHHGTIEGKTQKGIPVYNTCYLLCKKVNEKQPYVLITI